MISSNYLRFCWLKSHCMTDTLNRNLPPNSSLAKRRSSTQVLEALAQPFAILDLETTGLDPYQHEVIEIAALRVHARFQIADEYHVLIKPTHPLPFEITSLTGITQALLDNSGISLREGISGLLDFLGRLPVFAHYAPFDQGFLACAADQCRLPFENAVVDTLEVAQAAWPGLRSYSLASLSEWLGISRPTHRAMADAKATLVMLAKAHASLVAAAG